MFVNVSPASYCCGETLCSLNFAVRCRNVQLGAAKKSTEAGSGAEAARLREQVERLQEELAVAKGGGSGAGTPVGGKGGAGLGGTMRGAGLGGTVRGAGGPTTPGK